VYDRKGELLSCKGLGWKDRHKGIHIRPITFLRTCRTGAVTRTDGRPVGRTGVGSTSRRKMVPRRSGGWKNESLGALAMEIGFSVNFAPDSRVVVAAAVFRTERPLTSTSRGRVVPTTGKTASPASSGLWILSQFRPWYVVVAAAVFRTERSLTLLHVEGHGMLMRESLGALAVAIFSSFQ
jgi:hypothetical protein